MNVTSFGDTVFADYEVKMRSERVLNSVMGYKEKGEGDSDIQAQRRDT